MRNRLNYIEASRVVSVLCVLVAHLPEYLDWSPLSILELTALHRWWGEIGVSGFLILSAFGLTYSQLRKGSIIRLKEFFLRRFVRLLPLYYLAVFAWLWIVHLTCPVSLLTSVFGVHVFFRSFSRDMGSLWFMGLIVQWYFIFPWAYKLMHKISISVLWVSSFLLYALGLFLQARGLYVQDTLLFFWIEFCLGMDLARLVVKAGKNRYFGIYAILFAMLGFVMYVALLALPLVNGAPWVKYAAVKLGGISFFVLVLNISRYLGSRFERWMNFLSKTSYASYPVYLFHRPIWTLAINSPIWAWLLKLESPLGPFSRFVYLAVLGIPGIFAVGFWLQSTYDALLRRLLLRYPACTTVLR